MLSEIRIWIEFFFREDKSSLYKMVFFPYVIENKLRVKTQYFAHMMKRKVIRAYLRITGLDTSHKVCGHKIGADCECLFMSDRLSRVIIEKET